MIKRANASDEEPTSVTDLLFNSGCAGAYNNKSASPPLHIHLYEVWHPHSAQDIESHQLLAVYSCLRLIEIAFHSLLQHAFSYTERMSTSNLNTQHFWSSPLPLFIIVTKCMAFLNLLPGHMPVSNWSAASIVTMLGKIIWSKLFFQNLQNYQKLSIAQHLNSDLAETIYTATKQNLQPLKSFSSARSFVFCGD